jgi:hypothetical protein
VAEQADRLYALPVDEFTSARNAAAKDLARQGRPEAAAGVRALPKPTVASWALNQLARRHPDVVADVEHRGRELRRAQQRALAGDAASLRDARPALEAVLERAADLAMELLAGAGHRASDVHRARAEATLRAGATQEDPGRRLRAGTLAQDLNPVGFGLEDALVEPLDEDERPAAGAGAPDTAGPKASQRRPGEEAKRLAQTAREAELRAAHAEADAQRRRAQADRQRQQADEAAVRAQEAAQRAAETAEQATAAERAANELRQQAEAARHSADEARRGEKRTARRR